MKINIKKILSSSYCLVFFGFFLFSLASAHPPVDSVKVEPSQIDISGLNPGDTFTVDINIYGIPQYDGNFGGFELRLYYNKNVVDIAQDTDVVLDNFIFSTGRSGSQLGPQYEQPGDTSWKPPEDSNLDKCVKCGAFTFGTQDGPAGDGSLYHITFTIQNSGSTQLWINPDINALMISTANAAQLLVENVVHGNVSSGAEPEPDITIIDKSEEWIDPDDKSQGYKVFYTVKNQGNGAAGENTISLSIDGSPSGTQVCPALNSGNIYSGIFEGPFTILGDSDIILVCADSAGVVDESDETNNCKENVWSCADVTFDIGNRAGEPGSTDQKVEVRLANDVDISGIQVDICDAGDYLSLQDTGDVELTDRADGLACDFEDYESGCARLILYSQSGSVISAGDGPILILHYDVSGGAAGGSCAEITAENLLIADKDYNELGASTDSGSFFFGGYGDIYPENDDGTIGDGKVNIFDVLKDIQIILGGYEPAPCEFVAGDVPTGLGIDCQSPDEDINISDIYEMIAKILERSNCIDSY